MKRFKLLGIIVGIFAVVLIACFPMLMEDMDKSKIGINQIPISGTYELSLIHISEPTRPY